MSSPSSTSNGKSLWNQQQVVPSRRSLGCKLTSSSSLRRATVPNGRPERKNGAQKRKVDKSGLGRAIINRKARAARDAADPTLNTSTIESGLSSVTQENDLDEFLNTAQLADTDFSAERQNIKVVISDPNLNPAASHNPYLLTPQQEAELRSKQRENRERLQVPRRPPWTRQMTVVELERQERDAFLEWRRGLADLQDNQALLLTPFERNLEVWRQLWRTLERSDLIVQIVDARNPLTFRSEDLEKYVLELNVLEAKGEQGEGGSTPKRKNLLLINKADLLTQRQRAGWADYFESNNIQYAFFSAANGIALQEERARLEELEALRLADEEDEDSEEDSDDGLVPGMKIPKSGNKLRGLEKKGASTATPAAAAAARPRVVGRDEESDEESDEEESGGAGKIRRGAGISLPGSNEDPRTRILSVLELEDLFLSHAPEVSLAAGHGNEKLVVGLVGYPNVGKSSTINALIGEKKVSVSSTPGKTKHFQTIRLSPDVLLCDCPGLVFPQFASTKAELVCNGVLPIDQLREFTGPVELLTRRIPKEVLEGTYGLRIDILPENEGGTGQLTAAEFLTTFCIGRGFFTGGQGNPDHSRASRLVLKDYVNGKLLYCHPPPTISADDFNAETRDLELLRAQNRLKRKMAPTTRVGKDSDYYVHSPAAVAAGVAGSAPAGGSGRQTAKASALDSSFFGSGTGAAVILGTRGKKDAKDADGKKHYKKKREKQRSGRGYD
ncbi:ribosome biogenesis GTPase LSG1 [Rhodotorula paludigena]|uniref:ribosome biogenesis GTPase LSG1 n=1 Tax=Rhodotorula paludigena TaxID=86838 RepID=UPI003177E952